MTKTIVKYYIFRACHQWQFLFWMREPWRSLPQEKKPFYPLTEDEASVENGMAMEQQRPFSPFCPSDLQAKEVSSILIYIR